jgi:serine/threonine protein kinase
MYAALATDAGAHVGLLRPRRLQLLHDRLCLVTEWASGGTLATFLSDKTYSKGVDERLAAFMMRQMVAAVERLHGSRVAYRDIKVGLLRRSGSLFGVPGCRFARERGGRGAPWPRLVSAATLQTPSHPTPS